MYNRLILITIEGIIGVLNIIRNIEGIKEIKISIIIGILYIVINSWIKLTREIKIVLLINIISIILFITISKSMGIIFIILELYTMTIYILMNYNHNRKKDYTNILYFYINNIASIILLLIIGIIYIKYGIINIQDYKYISNSHLLNIIILIILFKLGSYPFNIWILKTYKEFDIKIIVLQSIFTKFIYLYLLILFSSILSINIRAFIVIIAIINIIVIAMIGINNNRIKEIIILSSLLNLSFLLITSNNYLFFLYYFILYSINTYLIIYFILYPYSISLLFILIFSLIGFPPFSGFFIKLFVLLNSFNTHILLNIFIIVILISSFISTNFYLKLINYFTINRSISSSSFLLLSLYLSLFIIFFSFFHPFYFYLLIYIL
jgi:NADH-quinone oxidoreductase subunit N